MNILPYLSHFTFRNGNYIFAYKVSHPSTYHIDVSMVTGAGLIGEYHKNETSFKNYIPDFVVASEQISFNTGPQICSECIVDRLLDDDRLFSYVRWMGYVSFPHTATFEVEMTGIEGKLTLWIGELAVLDTDEEFSIGSFRAYEHVLYEIKIEYSMVRERSCLLVPSVSFRTVQPNLTTLASYRISIVSCCSYSGHQSRQEEKLYRSSICLVPWCRFVALLFNLLLPSNDKHCFGLNIFVLLSAQLQYIQHQKLSFQLAVKLKCPAISK
jgi:hypothetical protein